MNYSNSQRTRAILFLFVLILGAYRKLDRESGTIIFAGCWTHARRYFADALKALPKKDHQVAKDTVAYEAIKRIEAIYHLDNQLSGLKPETASDQSQTSGGGFLCVGKRDAGFRSSLQRKNTGWDQLLHQP